MLLAAMITSLVIALALYFRVVQYISDQMIECSSCSEVIAVHHVTNGDFLLVQ
jgi:hypothetical protein